MIIQPLGGKISVQHIDDFGGVARSGSVTSPRARNFDWWFITVHDGGRRAPGRTAGFGSGLPPMSRRIGKFEATPYGPDNIGFTSAAGGCPRAAVPHRDPLTH